MTPKTRNIIGWILSALLAIVFIGSAVIKLNASEGMLKTAAIWGISPDMLKLVAFVEIIAIVLFIIPRTGLLGTLLVAAYLGGAIATHIEHGLSPFPPMIIEALAWITATVRFPELSRRLMGKNAVL